MAKTAEKQEPVVRQVTKATDKLRDFFPPNFISEHEASKRKAFENYKSLLY